MFVDLQRRTIGTGQDWMADSASKTEVNSRNETMHVLIVDDHAFVCVGLKATLSEEFDDIQVTTTDHGDTALTILSTRARPRACLP